jgi:hypothetical protein
VVQFRQPALECLTVKRGRRRAEARATARAGSSPARVDTATASMVIASAAAEQASFASLMA